MLDHHHIYTGYSPAQRGQKYPTTIPRGSPEGLTRRPPPPYPQRGALRQGWWWAHHDNQRPRQGTETWGTSQARNPYLALTYKGSHLRLYTVASRGLRYPLETPPLENIQYPQPTKMGSIKPGLARPVRMLLSSDRRCSTAFCITLRTEVHTTMWGYTL